LRSRLPFGLPLLHPVTQKRAPGNPGFAHARNRLKLYDSWEYFIPTERAMIQH